MYSIRNTPTFIEHRCAVEEQHILIVKRQPHTEPLRRDIADVDEGDPRIALCQQRHEAAAERIAEHDQLPLRPGIWILNRQQRFRPGEEDRIGVVPSRCIQIVDRQRCIRLIVVDRAGPQRVICEIRERIGCKIQRRLSAVDAAERRVQRHRLKFVRPVRAHRLGQPLRRRQNRLLPPVDVRPVIALQRQHIRQADGLCIVHTVREFLYKLFVIKRRIAVLFRQKVIFVWDCREINFRVRPLQIPLIDKAEPRQRMFH